MVGKSVILGLTFALMASGSFAQQNDGLEGTWQGDGGQVRIENCPGSDKKCVVVTSGSNTAQSMADIIGQTVVRDLVRDTPTVWFGRYVGDGENMKAKVSLVTPNKAAMRICLLSWFPFFFCETLTYDRVP